MLEVLLPLDRAVHQPVLLSCEVEDIRIAGGLLGVPEAVAVEQFVHAVVGEERLRQRGFADLGAQASRFMGREDAHAEPPPFFGMCCLLTLAASLMWGDERRRASNYYDRLFRELLGWNVTPAREVVRPEAMETMFRALARWSRVGVEGRRGHLEIPLKTYPRWAGIPVSQVAFRQPDRVALRRYFARFPRDRQLLEHLRSTRMDELLGPARDAVKDEKLEKVVLAAIGRARRDARTEPDAPRLPTVRAAPMKVAPAALQLVLHPQLTFRAFPTSGGRSRDLEPSEVLDASPAPEWRSEDAGLRLLLGDPITFVRDGNGALMQVPRVPGTGTCSVLTADDDLADRADAYIDEDALDELPAPWVLLRDVPVELVRPSGRGTETPRSPKGPVITLVAAPKSGRNAWLVDDPPRLALQGDDTGVLHLRLVHTESGRQMSTLRVEPGEAVSLFASGTAEAGRYEFLDEQGNRAGRFRLEAARTSWPTASWDTADPVHPRWRLSSAGGGWSGALWKDVPVAGRWVTTAEPVLGRLLRNGDWRSDVVGGTTLDASRRECGLPVAADQTQVLVSDEDQWLFTEDAALRVGDGGQMPSTAAAQQGVRVWFRGRQESRAVDARLPGSRTDEPVDRSLAALRRTVIRGLPGSPDGCVAASPGPDRAECSTETAVDHPHAAGDRVLRWLSGVGDVSRNRWREVCGVLGLDEDETLKQFVLLGYAEYEPSRRRVIAAPPVLGCLTGLGGVWLLAGARTHGLEAEVLAWASDSESARVHATQP
ncbi:MAG: hypothetical protein F2817_07370, partial [Actinobacteria bacterium]|nr:hypothetical protein [Actinomycetota bacterium]